MAGPSESGRERPWLMRTYAGHSSAAASNELFRRNLAKGQTGLSVAFDLPTQTGYDPDSPMAAGEVGKVGVPIAHIGDMRRLFADIPLDRMNTSMTINATAMWLLAMYVVVAEEQGIPASELHGTTQNDIIKEYLSRGTYIFPPEQSLQLITDMVVYSVSEIPQWNPINICSYHLQEAGATPTQEIAFALATAIEVLDRVRASGRVPDAEFGDVVARMSFFVNAGVRFIEEMCKMRAFVHMWDVITRERYGIEDPRQRRFRYGVQVNSLGLAEMQPENNVYRIMVEMLAVTLSKDARARAVQLPAWNEALGLPRPWDQQWSLRMQQVLAYETDLLEYDDLFAGSPVIERKVDQMVNDATEELQRVLDQGGAVNAVENGYMKGELVASLTRRRARIESGEITVVGVNAFQASEPSPLQVEGENAVYVVDPAVEAEAIVGIREWRAKRDAASVEQALERLEMAASSGSDLMQPSIDCARAGVTTGEWSSVLRGVFGEYRAPTGIDAAPALAPASDGGETSPMAAVAARVRALAQTRGRPFRFLVGKPGLDGHSNGAEQIAVRARDAGFEVVYQGIRLTPEQIVDAAVAEDVDVVGLSILSGSHRALVPMVVEGLANAGASEVVVVVGGIIPDDDAQWLKERGVAEVFTPKDYDVAAILDRVVDHLDS